MKNIVSVGLSRTSLEANSSFFKRLAEEISDFEGKGWVVEDVLLNFGDDLNTRETTSAMIILNRESVAGVNESYFADMTREQFNSDMYDDPSAALSRNNDATNEWLAKNVKVELYGAKSELIVGDDGKQWCKSSVYYSEEVE